MLLCAKKSNIRINDVLMYFQHVFCRGMFWNPNKAAMIHKKIIKIFQKTKSVSQKNYKIYKNQKNYKNEKRNKKTLKPHKIQKNYKIDKNH